MHKLNVAVYRADADPDPNPSEFYVYINGKLIARSMSRADSSRLRRMYQYPRIKTSVAVLNRLILIYRYSLDASATWRKLYGADKGEESFAQCKVSRGTNNVTLTIHTGDPSVLKYIE